MNRSHKIRLCPTRQQEVLLRKTAGCARYAYNWALEEWDKMYANYKEGRGDKPHAYTLSKRWTAEKPEWAGEVFGGAQTRAILNLGAAWIRHWNAGTKRPAFHKKGSRTSFYVANDKAGIRDCCIRLPCVGWVKMREELRFSGKIISYTVSGTAGKWWVAVQVAMPDPVSVENTSTVGVDVGIKSLAVASDGTVLENPRLLKKHQARFRRLQRRLSRQQKGSQRRQLTKLKLARLHLRISDTRTDAIHKFTARLAKNHGRAVLETLDIAFLKEHSAKYMRKAFQDTAMREIHRQLEYKMTVVKAPAFYRSSRTCSACGAVKTELPLSCRVYKCGQCGHVQDRDANAADNLKNMRWVTACKDVEPAKRALKRQAKTVPTRD